MAVSVRQRLEPTYLELHTAGAHVHAYHEPRVFDQRRIDLGPIALERRHAVRWDGYLAHLRLSHSVTLQRRKLRGAHWRKVDAFVLRGGRRRLRRRALRARVLGDHQFVVVVVGRAARRAVVHRRIFDGVVLLILIALGAKRLALSLIHI